MNSLTTTRKRSMNPFRSIFDSFQDMEREFDRWNHYLGFSDLNGIQQSNFIPTLQVNESEKEYSVSVEVPGIQKEDIDITFNEDNILIISGEKKNCNEEKTNTQHIQECCYGKFRREISMPKTVDKENICAEYKDGILNLKIPKLGEIEKETKRIEIQ